MKDQNWFPDRGNALDRDQMKFRYKKHQADPETICNRDGQAAEKKGKRVFGVIVLFISLVSSVCLQMYCSSPWLDAVSFDVIHFKNQILEMTPLLHKEQIIYILDMDSVPMVVLHLSFSSP